MSTEITPNKRREFIRLLGAASVSALLAPRLGASGAAATAANPDTLPPPSCCVIPQITMGEETILILLFPGFTAIDAIGPEYVLSGMMGAHVKFVGKEAKPIRAESGFEVIPTYSFKNCPNKPTLLLVPGGTDGVLQTLQDKETMDFIRRIGAASEMVGSVCTGSLLIGAAGLLNGYNATSHWQTSELLPLVGATPVDERVVFDRNRVTGAGVTAGLDLAFALVQRFRGDFYAEGMQLLAEYDPQPPFPNGGNHKKADPNVVTLLNEMHRPFVARLGDAVKASQ